MLSALFVGSTKSSVTSAAATKTKPSATLAAFMELGVAILPTNVHHLDAAITERLKEEHISSFQARLASPSHFLSPITL